MNGHESSASTKINPLNYYILIIFAQSLKAPQKNIVDELNGSLECPSKGLSGARTNKVMDDILKGYRDNMGIK